MPKAVKTVLHDLWVQNLGTEVPDARVRHPAAFGGYGEPPLLKGCRVVKDINTQRCAHESACANLVLS